MRTIEHAFSIFSAAPAEAARDALGLGCIALVIFTGFMAPVLF